MSLRHRIAGPVRIAYKAFRLVAPFTRGSFKVLLFHDVPQSQWAAFEALMAHIATHDGFIDPGTAARRIKGEEAGPGCPCLISFDDGFASNYRAARDVLARHDAKGLFFVCPGLVELDPEPQRVAIAANIFDGRVGVDDLAPDLRLMTWDELGNLITEGHVIGSHGLAHRRLAVMNADAMAEDTERAAQLIRERLGRGADWYAFTFGDIGSLPEGALSAISKRHAFCRSGVRGLNGPGTHPMAILADAVDLAAPMTYQKLIIEGGLDALYGKARVRLTELAQALS